jgi:competence protein ComEC
MSAKMLWAVVGGFLVGVLVRSFFLISWPFAALCALLGVLALLFILIDREKRDTLLLLAIVCIAFGSGVIRMDAAVLAEDPQLSAHLDTKVVLDGVVVQEPDVRESGVRISVAARSLIVGSSTMPVHGGVLVQAPPHADIAYGDVVHATGTLELPEAFDTGAGHIFNYPEYLAKDGILYELSFAQIDATGENEGNPAKASAIWVKHVLLGGLQQALPEPEAGLAAGITLGDKRSVGSDLSAVFVRASLVHIVVLSGYNITVVINAAAKALAWFPRSMRFGASGLVVAFFILMTGGAATAVRAGLMAFLAVYARLTGRIFIALRALAAAAFAMVLWNPLTLAFDPSFQLSSLATLGLVLLTPLFSQRLGWITERFGLREIVSSTLATQITVLPLLLYQSGNLSLVALPANLFALAAVPPAMGLASIAATAGLLGGPIALLAGLPAYVLLAYIIKVAEFFAALPFAALTVPAFPAWLLLLAYAALFGALFYYKKKWPEHSPAIAPRR